MTTGNLSQCPKCRMAFIGPPPESCPSCRTAISRLTEGTASDTDSIAVKPAMIQHATASAPLRCEACGVFIFGSSICPSCGGKAVYRIEPLEERPNPFRNAMEFPVIRPQAEAVPGGGRKAASRFGRRGLASFSGLAVKAQKAALKSPFLFFSIAFHVALLALIAQLVYMRYEKREALPLFLSFRDRITDLPEKPGDGDDVKEEEPKPAPVPPAEPKKEESAPEKPLQEEVKPPEAAVGLTPSSKAPMEKSDGTAPPTDFGSRSGNGKGDALRRFGGSHGSEAAVLAGLDWLARHQDETGRWSTENFSDHCTGERPCGGAGRGYYDGGLTGLALLCFLGAGFTGEDGRYAETVSRALSYIRQIQFEDGCYGAKLSNHMYNQAICTLAVAEAFALQGGKELRDSASRGIAFLVSAQQEGGGWDYTEIRSNRNDTSITGWAVMALKSAYSAGLEFPMESWSKAKGFINRAALRDGRVRYADRGFVGYGEPRYGIGMTAVGLLCLLYFGEDPASARLMTLADKISLNQPDLGKLRNDLLHTMYYWYYATLAMFHIGGERWKQWNDGIRDFLVNLQVKEGCARGSFDPDDGWLGPYAGRLYSTVFCVLNLEVYYRYLPLYSGKHPGREVTKKAEPAFETEEAIRVAGNKSASSRDRLKALSNLAAREGEGPLKALCSALSDSDQVIRWKAAESLGKRKDAGAVPALLDALASDTMIRTCYMDALGEIGSVSAVPALVKFLGCGDDRVESKAEAALREITGLDLGREPGPWEKWLQDRGAERK